MKPDDEAAFHEFVQSQWARLVRTAYLMTGDYAEAEDVVQTALARAGAAWRRIQASERPDAYVRRILVNCNNNRFRRKVPQLLFGTTPPDVPGPDPIPGIDQRDALRAALVNLPARQRAAVVLRYWEDLPEAEVALIMGCSVGTVKSQAARGLAKLRSDPALADVAPVPVSVSASGTELQSTTGKEGQHGRL
ncbi:SigE family RNA polymerase sigma factor [Yinghuangia seranimata]|uniref:SigE family RNA polymerase sigma factor n=1 Tax=Yinghuangia seranimata TaxID=408067 RepID=UPI00248B3621|nr:SigE family RNA polymerase sigma factor [Yinghuangia seranimata]MDI2125208.1 SigE family RNA polymerase sigma factor [Yinghuangia seranimata]